MNNRDIAGGEIAYRLSRIRGNLLVIDAVSSEIEDPTITRRIKEIRQAVASLQSYAFRKHGIKPMVSAGDL